MNQCVRMLVRQAKKEGGGYNVKSLHSADGYDLLCAVLDTIITKVVIFLPLENVAEILFTKKKGCEWKELCPSVCQSVRSSLRLAASGRPCHDMLTLSPSRQPSSLLVTTNYSLLVFLIAEEMFRKFSLIISAHNRTWRQTHRERWVIYTCPACYSIQHYLSTSINTCIKIIIYTFLYNKNITHFSNFLRE